MKTILITVLLLTGIKTGAQTNITNDTCQALFTYEVNDKLMSPIAATVINFYDKSKGNVKEWYWDFGDGNTSREQNPVFIFKHFFDSTKMLVRTYQTVNLTILTYDNCKSLYSQVINIMDTISYVKPGCKSFFTNFQTVYDSIAGKASYQLTNLSEGDSLTYFWKFDDNTSRIEKNPLITFDLKQPERKVCLTVSGKNNCSDTFCDAIYIFKPVSYPVDTITNGCFTYFGYSVNYQIKTFAPALVLDFYPKTSQDITEWNWDFGDGTSSNESNPTHIFNLPLVKDSILIDPNPFRKVCLKTKSISGCISNWCETIFIYSAGPDTSYVAKPECNYTMRINSSFPIQMSSCAGYAKALVFRNDTLATVNNYLWSTGEVSQEVKNLCPTKTYSVSAKTTDGCVVSSTFVFNSNGTVTETPVNWEISGSPENPVIQCNPNNQNYTVEWQLCDGTIVKGDSILLNSINCESKESVLILKDAAGNVVYTENISLKSIATSIESGKIKSSAGLFPNPVNDVVNILYSGNPLKELRIEIYDITGKLILLNTFYNLTSGQQISVNVYSLMKGIYLCKLVSDNQIIGVEKFNK